MYFHKQLNKLEFVGEGNSPTNYNLHNKKAADLVKTEKEKQPENESPTAEKLLINI